MPDGPDGELCSYCEDLSLMSLKDECSPGYGVLECLKALLQGCCSHGVISGFMLYVSKKVIQYSAAAEAAANEGMRVSESLLASAAVLLKYSMVQEAQHAAAAGAGAKEGLRVTESLFTSAAIALKYFKGKKAQLRLLSIAM